MLIRLLAAFILIPLIELVLLIWLSQLTSFTTTVVIVVVTGIIGSALTKREGIAAWHNFRRALGEGRLPSEEIQDGLMIVFAAALLLTPGLLTDAVGFTLLVPAGRRWVRATFLARFLRRFKINVHVGPLGPMNSGSPMNPGSSDEEAPNTIDATSVRRKD